MIPILINGMRYNHPHTYIDYCQICEYMGIDPDLVSKITYITVTGSTGQLEPGDSVRTLRHLFFQVSLDTTVTG